MFAVKFLSQKSHAFCIAKIKAVKVISDKVYNQMCRLTVSILKGNVTNDI